MSAGSPQRLPLLLAGTALWAAALCAPVAQAAGTPASASTAAQADAAIPAAPANAAVSLANARWEYKDASAFKRVSEYFGGGENTGYRLIARTDPDQRGGLYFQALLSKPASQLPKGSSAVVTYFTADSQTPVSHRFALPHEGREGGKTQLWLGFTGTAEAQAKAAEVAGVAEAKTEAQAGAGTQAEAGKATEASRPKLTAWEIRIENAEGVTLGSAHSFLWHSQTEAK